MPEQTPILKFKYGIKYPVQLQYDEPKTGEGEYGTWYRYSVKYEGQDMAIFASKTLNARLERYRQNDRVVIEKCETDDGKTYFDAVPEEGTQIATPDAPVVNTPNWDSVKTNDIHRQVCLKLAVQSMGTTKKDLDLAEVSLRMKGLLFVLDGLDEADVKEEDLPDVPAEIPPPTDDDLPF